MTTGPRMTLNLMPEATDSVSFYVGTVRMLRAGNSCVSCALCGAIIGGNKAAAHAIRLHYEESLGVLPGQLGLPETGVAHVPY